MLIAVASLKGSPGASRLAMSMAAVWPEERNPVLVECDTAGGTLAMRFGLTGSSSITSLAAATFRDAATSSLDAHAQRLPGGVAVVPAPADPIKVSAAVSDLTSAEGLFEKVRGSESTHTVVADCGRVDTRALTPIIPMADAVVLVARAAPEAVAPIGLAVESLTAAGKRVLLALRGSGYSADDLHRSLRIPTVSLPEIPSRWPFVRPTQSAYARTVLRLTRLLTQADTIAEPVVRV